ncbi:MAG: sigma-54 dependent transcriptional regulator [Candidatus Didemnitutus sp.]|nr:sigma-54 dependent transcriptional regulator [Candidatus Didemnitutus sp.]
MAKQRLAGVRILMVEDEPLLRKRYTAMLEGWGAEVTAVTCRQEAENALKELDFDVALLDVNLPDGRGTDLLRDKKIPAGMATLVMTAEGGVSGAVEAIRLGAADYLVKPFDAEELPVRIERARKAQHGRRAEEFRRSAHAVGTQETDLYFGPSLCAVEQQLRKIIAADSRREGNLPPVLIEGETGTGKTTFARWLHRHGPRAEGPLIEVNCSALPEALAESELFGHERGAFTDASATRIGLMEAAEGGTLFLDELPSLSPALQAKVLTAIEDRVIRRVGANRTRPVDVRIIAATNADLKKMVAESRFREDLLQRLDLFRVRIPPLRERGQDLIELAGKLATRIGRQYGIKVGSIPADGRRRLLAQRWPGNVRELAHEIERALVFDEGGAGLSFQGLAAAKVEGNTDAAWLSSTFVFPENGFLLETAIDEFVARALKQAEGNVSAAARLLGVSRDYVRYRLKSDPPAE